MAGNSGKIAVHRMAFEIEIIGAVLSSLATATSAAISSNVLEIAKSWLAARVPMRLDGVKLQLPNDTVEIKGLNGSDAAAIAGEFTRIFQVGKSAAESANETADSATRLPSRQFAIALRHLAMRLDEVRNARSKQLRMARASTWSSYSLTFGQYIIGGVLATSFIQQQLSPNIIGFFGVLVVLASLIKQHYHPEVSAKVASQKAAKLQALIRDTEDRITAIQAKRDGSDDNPDALLAIVSRITGTLTQIDNAVVDLTTEKKPAVNKKPKLVKP